MARRKKLFSNDPYRFGDYERYSGMGSVGGGPFSMETFHPGQALGHKAPRRTMSAREKRLRAEAEKEMLRRRLAQFQKFDRRGPVMPQPARAPAAYPIDHGQGDFPGSGAEMNERGMTARQWVRPEDKRRALHQENIARDLRRREADQELMRMQPPTEGLISSLSPGSASQIGVQEVAQDLIKKRAAQLRRNLVPGPDEPVVRQPTVEPWMRRMVGGDPNQLPAEAAGTNRPPEYFQMLEEMRKKREAQARLASSGLLADHGQDDPAGYEGWSPGELDELLEAQKRERYKQAAARSAHPDMAGIPTLGRQHTRNQIRQENALADARRAQATEFEQMEPTQPSFTQRALSQVLGVPVDLVAAGLNPLLEVLGAPEDVIKNPVGGREWLLKYFQTGGAAAVQNAKDALKTVYPAVVKGAEVVGDVVDDTTKFWGEQLGDAAEAVGVDKVSQIPGQIVEDTTEFWGDQIGDAATAVPKILSDAEEYWKPKTQQIGREFDRRWALRQEGKEAIERGLDDPGLLTEDPRRQPGELLAEGEEITGISDGLLGGDFEKGQRGPAVEAATGADIGEVTPKGFTKDDQKKAIDAGAGTASGSTVGGVSETQLDSATRAGLERVWGKHTYNPAQRRKKYMSQLKNIYQKAAWLDAIAAISGGKSRSSSYIERAVGMMDAMQKFDQEERLYNIWRDVYYDKDGNYDPPKSKKEAAERARRLGANPEETKSIYGWAEEGEDLQQWWRPDGKGGYETKYTKGKKARPAAGSGAAWEMGSEPSQLHAAPKSPEYIWAVPPGGGAAQYVDKRTVVGEQGWTKPDREGSTAFERTVDEAAALIKAGNIEGAKSALRIMMNKEPLMAIAFAQQGEKLIDQQIQNIIRARNIGGVNKPQLSGAQPTTVDEAYGVARALAKNNGKSDAQLRKEVEDWWSKK